MNYKNSKGSQVPTVVLAKVQAICDINAVQLSKPFLKFQGQTVQVPDHESEGNKYHPKHCNCLPKNKL